ncbi:MAG: holo-ACP synthase [Chloroflexi bacterium]|nr:holo-ACP synthase [Chloroflexota bacterium]
MQTVGIDIVEIARIRKAIARWGEVFLLRVYTDSELRLCRSRPSSLAARFAGKEAVIKALGVRNGGIAWKEIEILSDSSGKPVVYLHDKAQNQAVCLGLADLAVSLSHSRDYAIALVAGDRK